MCHHRSAYPVIRVKQPALARFGADEAHFSSISAQTMMSLPGCSREVTDCGVSFLNSHNGVETHAHYACDGAATDAVHGHINDFLVFIGLRSDISELKLPCFTAVRAEIT